MEQVKDILKEIKGGLSQVSSSQKDETRVMRGMLNDREYSVDVYGKEGKEGTYCPAKSVRGMMSSVIASTVKIQQAEAEKLVDVYEFKKSDANVMVDLSKEFVNTYLQSGRKLPLGARATSDVSLSAKHIDAHMASYPKQTGVSAEGNPIYGTGTVKVNAYDSVKVYSPCPIWVK